MKAIVVRRGVYLRSVFPIATLVLLTNFGAETSEAYTHRLLAIFPLNSLIFRSPLTTPTAAAPHVFQFPPVTAATTGGANSLVHPLATMMSPANVLSSLNNSLFKFPCDSLKTPTLTLKTPLPVNNDL
ncbi:hypothetical protein Y032_0078g1168 [Ancylostoma ceylanicum]|uniref:Uncharacterized protein n=1 Tax=Ancylostoma ceylanicum TaxID=53326 RepID=A0A016TUL5_9BILA|nr:hypothetical protein Y032_0078g1168 [Ancylostoma ceylanicum]